MNPDNFLCLGHNECMLSLQESYFKFPFTGVNDMHPL